VGVLDYSGSDSPLHYIESDHLGTPRVAIEQDRNLAVWTWPIAGEAFGNTPPDEDPDGDNKKFMLDMRFPGQKYDSASGLNYNYFRDYEPGTGRYTQSDPIGLARGASTYGYVEGNPFVNVDPNGLQITAALGGSSGAAGAAAGWFAPGAAIIGAGMAGYQVGSFLYPYVEEPLGDFIDWCMREEYHSKGNNCPPCKTISGKIVPVGTIGYRLDKMPPSKPHYPFLGDHYNLCKANQIPYPKCDCFWQPQKIAMNASNSLPPPPGSIPVESFQK